ncbi:MAG: hypothetical protein WDM86_11165 [Rhizomicrobium sp.]
MTLSHAAGCIAGALVLAAAVPYVRAILRRETKPHRLSWVVWAFVSVITAATYRASGGADAALVADALACTTSAVALLSLRYGVAGSSWVDGVCAAGAAASLVPWLAFHDAPRALYLDILVDLFALVPTLRKAWRSPESENRAGWALSAAGMSVNLIAVADWSLRISAYPLYCLVATGSVALVLQIRTPARAALPLRQTALRRFLWGRSPAILREQRDV